ncbi:hypothetical protein GCM10008995_16460 [Halobellus salinus]|uniref:Uncharacterized protein n=1 Tax=Halobellus salinus TaxID=931585 RepID=A0A830EAZ0_9EURY|nr:hypothetical protein [Halobellus salinus]GGJ07301.1 hypothetical protein GCM10008995_16460 [Halobellus salinus]SMP25937.1 hypothetical protein SAMN06265347_11134 [Halobellus salinus]
MRRPNTERDQGSLGVGTPLRIVLMLVVTWLVLEVFGTVLGIPRELLGPLRPLLGLAVVALLVLWLTDRL